MIVSAAIAHNCGYPFDLWQDEKRMVLILPSTRLAKTDSHSAGY